MSRSFAYPKHCFIAAEVSANHGGSLSRAVQMIVEAKKAGADAVKFQTYTADTMTLNLRSRYFMIRHPEWGGQSLHSLYRKAYTPWKWFKTLKRVAASEGITWFSSPFDKTAVDFLEELDAPLYKIASFELVDLPLIDYVARTKKPLIMSTGMASLREIQEAVSVAHRGGAKNLTLLKCVSHYPAKSEEMNLKTIPDMAKRFRVPAGLSDHTLGIGAPVAAVALGAKIIEKHFILSRRLKTADSFFSIEPGELKQMVDAIRLAESAIGHIHYGLTAGERQTRIFRRSLFVARDIAKGETLTETNIRSIRPAHGLPPKWMSKILGKKARKNLKRGDPLQFESVR